jgi:hypothetical protein
MLLANGNHRYQNATALLAILASAGNVAVPADAKTAKPLVSKSSLCNFGAWSSDTDSAGLNVRQGPSINSPIIGTLPPPESSEESGEDTKFATEFHVAEAQNGWFRIENAARWAESMSDTAKAYPALPSGWISGKKIYVTIYSGTGFSAPDPVKSKILWRGDWSDLQNSMTGMVDCNGEWAKVTYRTAKGEGSAWFRGICAIQETTCGSARDSAEEIDQLRKR